MAVAPGLAVALIGSAIAGCGNGVEAVAARTTLQEHVEQQWMAMMMSLNESMYQAVPGAGIVMGGVLAGLATPRAALAVAGVGALLVTAVAWMVLTPRGALAPGARRSGRRGRAAAALAPTPAARPEPARRRPQPIA